jgi:PAS domain S-box-containing protein
VSSRPLEAPRVQSTAFAGDTSEDAAHLLTIIEQQPSCLLRVGIDGRLLAANRSALRLLGTGDLAQVLNRTLTERIVPDHREPWRDFLTRVWEIGSGSIECDLTNVSGGQHTLLLQGVALQEHPDGSQSILMGARDLVQEHEAQRQQLETAHAADRARLQQTLAEERQLALMLMEREGRQTLEGMRAELGQARAEHQGLAILLAGREAEHAEEHHLALLLQEGEKRQMVDAAHREMELTLAELQRLEAELDQRDRDVQRLVAERVAERAEAEQGLAEAAKQIAKVLADHRVELQRLAERTV